MVCNSQRLGFIFKGGDADNRAKDLLLEAAHIVAALNQRRLNIETVIQFGRDAGAFAAGQDLSAFIASDLNIGKDLIELLTRRLRADHRIGIKGVAAANLRHPLHDPRHKGLVNRLLNQRAGRAGADLTLIKEAQNQAFNRLLDILFFAFHHVGKVDIRRFTAQLNGAGDNVFRRAGHDMAAYRR